MALAFGVAGLAPFFALAIAAIALADLESRAVALRGLHIYGAVILSFLGGCRWGFSSAGYGAGPTAVAMMIAVAPSLFAWAVLWLAPVLWIGPLLAAGVAAMLLEDARATRKGDVPPWWLILRLPLSAGAAASLAAPALF